jgi:hypothetical protein
MGLNTTPTFAKRLRLFVKSIDSLFSSKEIISPEENVNGIKLTAFYCNGELTAARQVYVMIQDEDTNNHYMGSYDVPADAGRDPAIPPVDLLAQIRDFLPVDKDGQAYLPLDVGQSLWIAMDTDVTESEEISFFAIGASFDDEAA